MLDFIIRIWLGVRGSRLVLSRVAGRLLRGRLSLVRHPPTLSTPYSAMKDEMT